ncbi:MAG: CHAT domain-containing protein [Leptolyngbya sp. SIOISBB]|nr:CHAT domain-containing protein [Leptolyngbya sp. SIOISBB]
MLLPLPVPAAITLPTLPPVLSTTALSGVAANDAGPIALRPMLSPETSTQPQFSAPRLAQAVIPNGDGTGTVVTPDGNQLDITGGQLSGDGANLFHSFQEFGLTAEQVANFIASPEIQNILSGVNGGNPSVINGLLRVSGSSANLYLINPAGIVFGPTGAIDLTGSFTATTANQVGFGDAWLDVQNPTAYETLVGPPNGFAFTGDSSGAVLNLGDLAVDAGESITLLGGEVINLGTITAPEGTITLAAIPSENLVRISQENQLLSLEIAPPLTATGQLSLHTLALPELLTGSALTNTDLTVVQAADGTVRLESATAAATVDLGSVIASGEISTAGGQGGQIYLLGQQVSLLSAAVNASGQSGGDIRIGGDFQGQGPLPNAQFSLVDGGSTLQADGLTNGDGGTIVVWADDTTRFLGNASVRGGATGGDGGWVEVSGLSLLEFSGEVDASAPLGTVGTLLLDPTNIEIVAAGGETSDLSTVDEFADANQGMDDTTQINVAAINSAVAKVILQATNDITFSTDVALVTDLEAIALNDIFLNSTLSSDDGVITLRANNDIQLNGIIDTNEAVTITADADGNGIGGVFSNAGTAILSDGGMVDISGAGLQLGSIITTDDIPGTVNLESSKNITFEAIDTSASGPDAGADVNILANGTVQGLAAGITIDAQGGIVGPSGTVTIQHDGGPTNAPFSIGDASVNGTAGAIAADSTITSGTFDVQPTGGTDNPSPSVTITSINTPPTLATPDQLTTEVDQPLDFTVADLNPMIADVNNDITTLEVVSIPSGTLLSNGVLVQPGDAIAPTDSLRYIPPVGTTGNLTAFTLRASDGVASSEPVAIAINITASPLPPETLGVLDPTLRTDALPLPDLLPTEQTLIQGMPLAQSPQLEELSILGMVLPEPGFLIVAAIAISADEDGIFPPNGANAPAANVPSLDVAAAPNVTEGQPEGGLGPGFGQAQEPGGGGNGSNGGGNGGGNGGEGGGEEGGEEEPATLDPEPTEDTSDADSGLPLLTDETEPSPAATDDGTDTGDTASEDVAALPADDDDAATSTRNDEANAGLRNCQETVEAIDNAAASDRTASLYAALIDCYEANLTTATEQEDTRWIAYSLNNLAISHAVTGDYLTALDLYQQQLEQAEALNDPTQIGIALGGLGATYAALGDYATAIDFYGQSLRTLPLETAPQWKALVYRNLGNAYFADADYESAAQQQLTSLDISRGAGDSYGEMQAYGNLASTRAIQGQFDAAIALHEQGLALAETLNNDLEAAQLLLGLGTTYAYQQNYEAAYRTSQEALAIARRLGASLGEGIALTNVGNALLYLERLIEAEQVLLDAVTVWENVRAGLGTSDAFKVSIFETQLVAYRNLQEVLVAQGKTNTALEISERSRARAFVELLARGQGSARAADSVPPPNLSQMQQIAAAQNATLVEYAIIRDQFAEPPHAASVQNPVAPQDAQLYIWVVSPSGVTDFRQVDLRDLSGTTAVADLVQATRLTLTGRDRNLIAADRGIGVVAAPGDRSLQPGDRSLQPGDRVRREDDLPDIAPYEVVRVSPDGQTVTVSHPDFVLPNPNLPASELSRVAAPDAIARPPLQQLHDLLIAPIADLLPSNPDDLVIFVPQEQLFLTPFAALQDAQGTYVIEQHTIAIAPSIQTLALTNTGAARSATTNALIVGNPSPMPEAFAPLPNAELEANTVADLLSTEPLVRSAATEADVKASLASADIIHLATHGRFDGSQPLQGAIALAPDAQNDGFLTAAEILELPLQARLAILSACDTGRGRITGDGVVGLSRSFMAAGVPQVVVSLWQVPDAQTAELMIDFHEARLQSDRTPQALRQAMLASLETYADPAIWSAFTQVGNLE